MPCVTQYSIHSQDPLPPTSMVSFFLSVLQLGSFVPEILMVHLPDSSSGPKVKLSHFTGEEARARAACPRSPGDVEAATRPSIQFPGVAGFVPEGRAVAADLWDP